MCNGEKLGNREFSKRGQESPLCRGDQGNDKKRGIPSGDPSAKRSRWSLRDKQSADHVCYGLRRILSPRWIWGRDWGDCDVLSHTPQGPAACLHNWPVFQRNFLHNFMGFRVVLAWGRGFLISHAFFYFFNWSIVDLQSCVSFRCTAKQVSYTCTQSCLDLWGPMDYSPSGFSVHRIFQAILD